MQRSVDRVWIADLLLHSISLSSAARDVALDDSQLPLLAGTVALPLSLLHQPKRTGVLLDGAACDEMTPGTWVRGLLQATFPG